MKRIINAVLSGVLACSLVGCSSGSSNSSDGIVLTFWAHQNEPWNNSYKEIISAFEAENKGITINLETFPYDDFESKVQTSLINGEGGADIYEIWGGWGIDYAPSGALMALPDDFASQIEDETYPATYGALMSDGKLYGMPLEFNIEYGGMLVNLNLLKEYNLQIPETWDQLVKTAEAGSKKEGDVFSVKGFDFVNWDSVPYLFLSMILQQGSNYLNEDGSFNVNTPEAKKAFQELTDLVIVDGVTNLEGLNGGAELEGYQQLYANRALMVPRGPWTISEGVESFELTLGTDFDYVALPWYSTEHKFAAETGWALAINESCAEQEAALKFIKYVYQDDVMLQHNIDCTQIPSKKSLANNETLLEQMPYASILFNILDGAQFIGYFNTDRLKETINTVFVDYCSGKYTTIDETMTVLEDELNAIRINN